MLLKKASDALPVVLVIGAVLAGAWFGYRIVRSAVFAYHGYTGDRILKFEHVSFDEARPHL